MKSVRLFSDGSSLGNPGAGGWAYILEYKGAKKCECGGSVCATNNQMELTATIMGLKALKEPCEVELITDSQYVVNAINSWLDKWIKTDFKNKKNEDLWREYIRVANGHKITAIWVKGHAGHPQNEACDSLARGEAQKYKKA